MRGLWGLPADFDHPNNAVERHLWSVTLGHLLRFVAYAAPCSFHEAESHVDHFNSFKRNVRVRIVQVPEQYGGTRCIETSTRG